MRRQQRRHLLVGLSLFILAMTSLTALAQSPVIAVQPISGPVGTTVTITDQGGNRGNLCYAQIGSNRARGIGNMAGSISYVVDTNLTAGAVISFWCNAGTSQQTRSNVVRFTVTPPVVADTDGDGLPDSRDECPREAGPVDNRGCPAPQPVDSDGDGLPDDVDACPAVFGPANLNGCAPSPVPLPPLPADGACVAATRDTGAVNIRQGTSTDTPIVGTLDPYQIYAVIGRNADASWLQINGGWIAAFVTRQGGDCSALPQTDAPQAAPPQPEIAAPEDGTSEIGLLLPAIQKVRDVPPQMENCQELMPQVDALPTFLALSIIGEPDPCAAAQNQIDDLFFNQPVQSLPSPMPDCQGFGGDDVLAEGQSAFFTIYNQVPQATRSYLEDIANGMIGSYCLLLFDLAFGGITGASSPVAEHALPMSIAYCDISNQAAMTAKVQALNVDASSLYSFVNACELYQALQPLGSTSPANAQFFSLLTFSCGVNLGEAGTRALLGCGTRRFRCQCSDWSGLRGVPVAGELPPAARSTT